MSNVFLSVVIPSYNRAEITKITVESVLKYSGSDLDCIVVDNHSDDNTLQVLSEINDPRLKVYVNSRNLGHNGNLLECWKYADGEYSLMLLSRDTINSEKIPELIENLKKYKPVMTYCLSYACKDEFFPLGKSAFRLFAYGTWHPSGHIFKTDVIHKVLARVLKNRDITKTYDDYGYLPLDFITAEIMYYETGTFIKIIKVNGVVNMTDSSPKYRSIYSLFQSATKEVNKNIWWFPSERTLQFEKYIAHMNTLNDVDDETYNIVFMRLWKEYLFFVTYRFKEYHQREFLAQHYGLEPREVPFSEISVYNEKFREAALALDKKYPGRLSEKSLFTIRHPCFTIRWFGWEIKNRLLRIRAKLSKIKILKKFYNFIRGR